MDVKTEWNVGTDVENTHLSNIPNAKTQAAMLDADAWVVEMRANESQTIPSNASSYPEIFIPKI